MARKANIAKEEIIEACWKLIEGNTFPNIPRLSQYFKELDGRGCSNTTLLNGINDWEEAYREYQESEVKDIGEQLTPSFKRFERDVVQSLSVLLDEKVHAYEQQMSLRKEALEGRGDSLSQALIASEAQLEQTLDALQLSQANEQQLQTQKDQLAERLDHALARNRVLEKEQAEASAKLHEADTKLSQAQVDLAKQDQTIQMLNDALMGAQQQIELLQKQNNSQYEHLLDKALHDLQDLAKTLKPSKSDA
ncbi:hypothetical protein MAQ5080_01971 [Marinomonas aquimarina]|uniref:Chromosome partition protein Smc n=1 Tax=Marinomonas aquimarina TaxID=295068 RepID=A0A1A8TFV7_9GAMM|nr:hypothetical protein [Marinomonas aquimarina]SBS31430.1 hypothetical protein MAQ5080_01971 [Marinomonas aquimarina]